MSIASDKTTKVGSNPRGIPQTVFVENVEEFLKDFEGADQALVKLQDNYSKYKFMESRLTQSKVNLKTKLPELKKTLETVQFLESKKDDSVLTRFELADNVFASAQVKKPSAVCLWLGANVMIEYTFDEAKALLTKNLESAQVNLAGVEEDLEFIKDQITTTEIARIYNYDVKQRRKLKTAS